MYSRSQIIRMARYHNIFWRYFNCDEIKFLNEKDLQSEMILLFFLTNILSLFFPSHLREIIDFITISKLLNLGEDTGKQGRNYEGV